MRVLRPLVWRIVMVAGLIAGLPATAQDNHTSIVVVDLNRLVNETEMGAMLFAEIEDRGLELQAENDRIFAELRSEEQSLAALRPSMSVEDFQVAANGFDARVQQIRTQQDEKQRAYEQMRATGSERIVQSALPILNEIMTRRGADVVLQTGVVIVARPQVDITDEAIVMLDLMAAQRTPDQP